MLYVAGRPSLTNARLVAAFQASGLEAAVVDPPDVEPMRGDVVLARLDVRSTLDGVEDGLWRLKAAERAGARVLNRPGPLLSAHDKLATAILLGRAGVLHPRTVHAAGLRRAFPFGPPYVVKPRFGSWGKDVLRCESLSELEACLRRLVARPWFQRQGVLVQELVRPTGIDLRLVVARGEVVGAVCRIAPAGEWRTNVALGAVRRPVEPPPAARAAALRATEALGIDLAGVDVVVRADGSPVVLELNGAVDYTPEYGLAGADPFAAAADALVERPAAALAAAAR
jgi:RimK family alpha-L-glutamate ligase